MRIEITYENGDTLTAGVVDPTWRQWAAWQEAGFGTIDPGEVIEDIDGYADKLDAPYSIVNEITSAWVEVLNQGKSRESVRRVQ